jgi:hypothetical protein
MNTIESQVKALTDIQTEMKELKRNANKINEELYFPAMKLLAEVAEFEEINGLEYLNICKIKDGTIYYYGEVSYSGETDYYSFDLEAELLYDETEKKEYIDDLKKEKQKEEDLREQQLKKKQEDKEKYELEVYKKLKKQFENK